MPATVDRDEPDGRRQLSLARCGDSGARVGLAPPAYMASLPRCGRRGLGGPPPLPLPGNSPPGIFKTKELKTPP